MQPPKHLQKKNSLANKIADKLRDAIIDARFEFGESLSEENLAAVFSVSRTPIREALGILQLEDLVTIVPKSGTYIFTPTLVDISELCDYREGLELQALKLAMAQNPSELAAQLFNHIENMEYAVKLNDSRAYGRYDTDYHLSIIGNSGNRYLERGYRMILGRIAALRTQLAVKAEGEPARSLADHRLIAELISSGKSDKIKTVLSEHVRRTKENYLSAFQNNSQYGDLEARRLREKILSSNQGIS